MKSLENEHPTRLGHASDERRWGHPLLGFARFLVGTGFWISHGVIVVGVVAVLLLTWFDATINDTVGALARMLFRVACLFAFAGWLARRDRR